MHALRDPEDPFFTILHNPDWSGSAIVRWRMLPGSDYQHTKEWQPLAQALVHGFAGVCLPDKRNLDEEFRDIAGQMVPRWVVARATALAAWDRYRSKMLDLVESVSP